MFICVRSLVDKCTENSEGVTVYEKVSPFLGNENVRVSFDGVVNVSEDFLCGFLGSVIQKNKESYKTITYV